MRILQLNVWMGKIEGNLRRFLEQNDFDIICMQEVMASEDCTEHFSRLCFDLSQIIQASHLPYHFFSPNWGSRIANGNFELGNLILSRLPFKATTSEFINGEYHTDTILAGAPRNNLNIQIATLENGLSIVNHHGYWQPNPIGNDDSIVAFTKASEVVRHLSGPIVMCGDLNVIHDSPAMRSFDFLHDLTHEYGITNTLSGLKYNGAVACDHILVNNEIKVNDFRVHDDLVSDHLALSAEFDLKS